MVKFEYLLKKIGQAGLTLFVVMTFNFFLFRILPGDPIRLMARAGRLDAEAIQRLKELFGLDKPLPMQFLIYLRNLFSGQLGVSITYRRPVADILQERIANSLALLALATVLVIIIGIGAGMLAAARRGSKIDSSLVITSLVFWSMPTFWTGLILVIIFGVYFRALPISGLTTPGADYATFLDRLGDIGKHLVLPTITLSLVDMGQFMLITRSTLVDVLTEDYIQTARAKGQPFRRVLWRHGVPNALLPIVTSIALYVSLIIGGAIQVETVFSFPGMGRLMYDAVLRRDYPILEASFLLFAVMVVLSNLIADLLYLAIDPRVREA